MRRLLPILAFLLLCCSAHAQSATASITGRVTDPSKAVVPGARVVAINTATNVPYYGETDNTGNYTVSLLPPGVYRLEVEKQGFRTILQNNVTLHIQDVAAINFEMAVGSASESITVSGSTPVINTTDGSVGTVIDRQFVGNLPLNGRTLQTLIALSPGVIATPSNLNNQGEFSINGQRQDANYFTVDGVSANTGVSTLTTNGFSDHAAGALPLGTALGTTSGIVSVDALQEFRIETSTYSAEYGRQPGGQIQFVTRSGSNQFHGSAFEYLRNDALDAQNWFNAATAASYRSRGITFRKPALRQNQFGGTLGGPVVTDKTFFFFSYEGQRNLAPVVQYNAQYVPMPWLRQLAAPALQPFLNAYPLPNGPEVQVLEHPNSPYDAVNNPYVPSGFGPISIAYSNPASVDAYSLRIDQAVGNRVRLFGRITRTPSFNLSRNLSTLTGAVANSRTVTLGTTFSFNSRLNNEFRSNYAVTSGANSEKQDNFGGATPITLSQFLSGYNGPSPAAGLFTLTFAGLAIAPSLSAGPTSQNVQHQLNVLDNVSWIKGKPQIKFGIDWRHLTPTFGPFALSDNMTLDSGTYPPDYTSFLNRVKTGTVNAKLYGNRGTSLIYNNISTYVQDTWKAQPRLTIDAGLRWDINPPPDNSTGVQPLAIIGVNGVDVSGATLAPAGTQLYKTVYTAFAPRFGAAYQLKQASGRELVLRGGFGLFYDMGTGSSASGYVAYGYPFFSGYSRLNNITLPLTSAEMTLNFPTNPTLPLRAGPLYVANPNLKVPYTLQWNVSLEQAIGNAQTVTLSYVASATRKLTIIQDLNEVPTATTIIVGDNDNYRPNPNFQSIYYLRNAPTSDYESFQGQYQRRLSRGLQAVVNYTWSHALDQASFDMDNATTLSRSNAAFDVRHNFSAAVTYEFPKLRGTGPLVASVGRLAKAILNGWSIDSILTARSGLPLDVTISAWSGTETLPNGVSETIRPNIVPGQPVWISSPGAPGGKELNVNAFSFPSYTVTHPFPDDPNYTVYDYQQGNLARNSVRQPGIYQLNMGIRRQFDLTERWKLQASVEAFNVFNHPLFSGYNTAYNPANTGFGLAPSMLSTATGRYSSSGIGLSSLYQNGGPRDLQIALRLSF